MKWEAFEYQLLSDAYRDWYHSLIKSANFTSENISKYHSRGNRPDVSIYFLKDRDLNAKARFTGDKYEIGIHISVPCILHYFFNNLLRTQSYLTELGNMSNETILKEFPNGMPVILPDELSLKEALEGIVNFSRPKDDQRAWGAVTLTEFAVRFIIYHEINHVEFGHVDANEKLFKESEFCEFFSLVYNFFPNYKMRQIWEYEADIFAGLMIMNDSLGLENVTTFQETLMVNSQTDKPGMIGYILSALYAVFLLFGTNETKLNSKRNHPHSLVRYASVVSHIIGSLRDNSEINVDDDFNRIAYLPVMQTYNALIDLGFQSKFNIKSTDLWSKLMDNVDKLENNRMKHNHEYSHLSWLYPFEK